jgi:hypothetical protein
MAEINKKFKEKFSPGSSQKYHIKICALTINDEFIGVDIQILD